MQIGTRQRITHHNVTVHIGVQVLTEVPHIKYLGVFIDQHLTWQKHTLNMFFRESGGSYIAYIVYSLCPIQFYFNCIKVLFFPLLTTVTLYGLPQQLYFQNLWSEYMPDLLATCLMMLVLLRLPWQNAATFIQLFKCIKFYISLYLFIFRICLHFLRMLPDMLAGTVIACFFLECELLMDKKVCCIEGW